MSLVKCAYCQARISARMYPLHLKHCINYRRMLKAGKVKDGKLIEQKETGTKTKSINSLNKTKKVSDKINSKVKGKV